MVRKSLLAVLLLAIATPLTAQESYTWTSKRADAIAPGGVHDAHILNKGQLEISYRFEDLHYKGLWYQQDSLSLSTALGYYRQVPLTLSNATHYVNLGFGLSDNFTLEASARYSSRTREQAISDSVFYTTNAKDLEDVRLTGLYRFYNDNGYEGHLQFGVLLPTGKPDINGRTPFTPSVEVLPYDMQIRPGTFALLPGMTAQAQNGMGSVGAQVRGVFYVGMNSEGYRLGNRVEATGWAALKLSDDFSVSMRVDWQHWGHLHGQNPNLDPKNDPTNDAYFLGGQRLDLPIGINFYMPKKSPLAGQRITVEMVPPVYRKYNGPQLGLNWGLHLGWQMDTSF